MDLTGDEARVALEGEVAPQPLQGDGEAAAEADEEPDVGGRPEQPGQVAAELDAADLHDRAAAADRREVAEIAVAEGRHRAAGQRGDDRRRDVLALLLGDRRDAR